MKELIKEFPKNIEQAHSIAKASQIVKPEVQIKNIVMCGLGGSGIGGKIMENWTQSELCIPCICVNEYSLPAFVSKHTLVIATSYSGNTEETIYSINQAHDLGAQIVGITSGGKLERFCSDNKYPCILIPPGNPPRSALAFSLMQLAHVLYSFELISDNIVRSMISSIKLLEDHESEIHKLAQKTAKHLFGKVGIFYSETKYEGVVVRARQQFNENSKYLGWHHVIPEMNHNELVGWSGGDERFAPIFIMTEDVFSRNKVRFEITMSAIKEKCKNVLTIHAQGKNIVERTLFCINILDWASYYLCEMNGADIMDIAIIDYLKGELSKG